MASAAAVGAHAAESPAENDIGADAGNVGEVTSAIGSRADGITEPGDEDDVRGTARRKGPVEAAALGDSELQLDGEDGGGGDDLFGDEDDDAPADKPAKRQLDDEDLDSGDDMDRTDRVADEQQQVQEEEYEQVDKLEMNLEMPRQPLPEPSDGEMYLVKVPDFLAIEPTAWDHTKFQPPTSDHHSRKGPSAGFSAYNTALTTIRWRRSPNDPTRLQSNARVLRWSDGSTTLQLASLPQVQYEMDGNPLAPPQRNPVKPTPVSVQAPNNKGGRQGDGTISGERYDSSKDAFTYLGVPSETTGTVRITNKITAGLSVRQTANEGDEAIEKLQAAMAAAANAVKVEGGNGKLQLIDEDPDMKRAEAERAMREKQRADRKKEAAVQREMDKTNRALGRHGLSSGRYGGLNSSFLEDEELGGGSRPKKGAGARRPKQRRNSIYSDDEDFGRRHFTSKEDEYDEEDDFVARSSEEELVADDDDDDDDGIVEEPRHRERTPKRDRPPPAADEDADAEGEVDEDVAPAAARKRHRVVVDDDEE